MPTKRTLRSGAMTSRRPLPSEASRSARLGLADEIAARFFIRLETDQALFFGVLEQVRKRAVTVVGLVEAGLSALQGLLDHRAPDFLARAALGRERLQRLDDEIERLVLLLGARPGSFLALLGGAALLLVLAHQVVVVDELVAIGDEQVARGVLHAHADHFLVVLAQLGDERREIRVAADDDEGVDVRF